MLLKPSPAPFDVDTHLASIIESSDDVIVSKTLEGVITSWNPAAERILGYTAAEAIGQNIRLIIPHDRWPEEDDVLARIRRGERVDHFETVRRAKDGHMLNISLTVSPIRDRSGRIVGASKVARDITERKRAEAELERLLALEKQSRQQAEEASRLKDEFLAVVSHELRSPLNAITGWASLLLMRPLDEQTKHAIETILRNAQTQTQLVADLLDVSRIVTGQLRLNVRSFQLIPVNRSVDRSGAASGRREVDSYRHDTRSISRTRRRRPRPHAADFLEPTVQRGEVHAEGWPNSSPIAADKLSRRSCRLRHGQGSRSQAAAAYFRALPAGRQQHDSGTWRTRPGPGDRAPPGRASRRCRQCLQRGCG